jgi:hypothetical protein
VFATQSLADIEERFDGRPTLLVLEPVEQIGKHGRDDARLPHQRLGLETLDVGDGEIVFGRVEQPAERPFQRIGRQRRAQRGRLKQ